MPPVWLIGVVVLALVVIAAPVVRSGADDGGETVAPGRAARPPSPGAPAAASSAPPSPASAASVVRPWPTSPASTCGATSRAGTSTACPAPGSPRSQAVITNNDADNPPKAKEGAIGGATSAMDGSTLTLLIPDGDQPAEASFEPGAYSTAVVIILKDSAGTTLPVEAFTVGGGDSPSVNPITATQVMTACGS